MNQVREMTNAVDAALERVRGELTILERTLAVLRDNIISEPGVSVDLQNAKTQPIGNASEEVREWQSLDGLGRVLSRELWLPEYGASPPLEEQA